ncbi:MAG: dTDP-4-dehydrorhamnose reductase [Thermoleophilaceae bacterium]|nr:dTDP-4-dehydrorhamnose reductase [Thermoleophilaceae bacterium]
MLGRDVVAAAERAGHDAVGLARADLDVTDGAAVERAVATERPDVVVNCAAYTNVDGAESDEAAATRLNGHAAGLVAHAAASAGAAVVQPSTDYVFDGSKRTPYVESDPTGPEGAYGRSKLAGEHAVASAAERHFIVRTSWLFGVAGKNFADTMLALGRDRDELKVVHDQVGCPTYTGHLAEAIVRLAGTGAYGMHHVAGGGKECSWFEFATEIFRQAEVDVRVVPCTTEEFPRPAPRPAYSVLGSERADAVRLPDWREGLASYLAERAVAR